jgi:hypothetical protein
MNISYRYDQLIGSDTLVILLSGIETKNDTFEYLKMFNDYPCSKLFIREVESTAYTKSVSEVKEILDQIDAKSKYRRIVSWGCSLSATGAIILGLRLNLTGVVAISPHLRLDRRHSRIEQLLSEGRIATIEGKEPDLTVQMKYFHGEFIRLIFSTTTSRDAMHIIDSRNLNGIEFIKVELLNAQHAAEHDLLHCKEININNYIDAMLNNRNFNFGNYVASKEDIELVDNFYEHYMAYKNKTTPLPPVLITKDSQNIDFLYVVSQNLIINNGSSRESLDLIMRCCELNKYKDPTYLLALANELFCCEEFEDARKWYRVINDQHNNAFKGDEYSFIRDRI